MKALLLAAGLGTRLRPFTFFQAKSTLPLFDVPFLHFPLQYLHSQGVDEVVINLHAHPESVRKAAGSEFQGMRIQYSHEPEILGTAGALRKAGALLGDGPFAVLNSDLLSDVPLREIFRQHRERNDLVTLAVMSGEAFPQYSGLQFEGNDPPVLSGIRGPGRMYHYTGIQVVSPEILECIPPGRKSEIFQDIYPQWIASGRITGFLHAGMWMEIGTLHEYLQTGLKLSRQSLPAMLRPPGMGQNLVSTRSIIEEGARVEESIVMEGAVIRAGVSVRRSIIGCDVAVTADSNGLALARGITPWRIGESAAGR